MQNMKTKILNNTLLSCTVIFLILIAVHAFEAIVLRMDETFFAENFINKLFGIAVTAALLKMLGWRPQEIGFARRDVLKNLGRGAMLGLIVFSASFAAECLMLKAKGKHLSFGIFTTGFSLTGQAEIRSGIGFILMCICFNIINVMMEEGTFRGLFSRILSEDHTDRAALLIQALLFGVWHIVTPLHNLIDGDLGIAGFAGLSIGYIILAGMMGVKWGLIKKLTGSLYAGMADHFFNNCIATNLLHITTETGTDELMLIRVAAAQLLSFVIVLTIWKTDMIQQKRRDL